MDALKRSAQRLLQRLTAFSDNATGKRANRLVGRSGQNSTPGSFLTEEPFVLFSLHVHGRASRKRASRDRDGLVTTIALMVLAVTLHELGHLAAALSLSLRVKRLGVNLRGIYIVRETGDPVRNAVVIIAGPAMNLLLAAVFGHSSFGSMNLVLAVMNLLPLPHTDGRHLAQCIHPQPA